jgi:hypothetical protein
MTTLYSYCIPIDDGAAPNPFGGICTLVICKPAIRRVAQVGDWVVGTGSVNSPIGDIRNTVVYAMQISQKMTMQEYDTYVQKHYPDKVPKWFDRDVQQRLGDAIYDYSSNPPRLRPSVHTENNRKRDLSGEYALISDHFFYFGDKPLPLPEELCPIAPQQQGHRSRLNAPYIDIFLEWILSLEFIPNQLHGDPQYLLFKNVPINDRNAQVCQKQNSKVELPCSDENETDDYEIDTIKGCT